MAIHGGRRSVEHGEMDPVINGTARVVRNSQVAAHELGGSEGGVLLHLQSGQYHGIDSVGWAIWALLDGSRTVDELAADLRGQYPDASDRLGEDVRSFVQGLLERKLAEIVPAGGDARA